MIVRIWQGWTQPENAEAYEALLKNEVLPGIREKGGAGLLGIELLRRDGHDETEFMTIFRFDSVETVKRMAGDDPEAAYVPDSARKVLSRFETRARHFEKRI